MEISDRSSKKILKQLPKLHLACCSDELRPTMEHILVTKKEVCATDSYLVVVHKTSDLFSDEFIDAMPDRFLIHRLQWAKFWNNHRGIYFSDNCIRVVYNDYDMLFPIKSERNIGGYPEYERVFPLKKRISADKPDRS